MDGVYLDHAASTPLRPEAAEAWARAHERVGNPSSVHAHGRAARAELEGARERLAAALGAHPTEVVFTAGGTESVHLALNGLWRAGRGRLVVGAAEHAATLDTAEGLRGEGADVRVVPVDEHARVRQDALEDALAADGIPAVVGLLWASNEVGTVERVGEVAGVAARHGALLHWDAVAAVGRVPVDFAASGAAALSVAGHKLGAPAGTGALLLRRGVPVADVVRGGGQQPVRSGTVDVAGAAALAVAVELAVVELEGTAARMRGLADRLRAGLGAAVPDARPSGDPDDRLPGLVHVVVPGVEGESLVLLLDRAGVSGSVGSACRAGVAEPSHVLIACGLDEAAARAGLRLSLGRGTTEAEVDAAVAAVAAAVPMARTAFSGQRP